MKDNNKINTKKGCTREEFNNMAWEMGASIVGFNEYLEHELKYHKNRILILQHQRPFKKTKKLLWNAEMENEIYIISKLQKTIKSQKNGLREFLNKMGGKNGEKGKKTNN